MHIGTHHGTLLASDCDTGTLRHVPASAAGAAVRLIELDDGEIAALQTRMPAPGQIGTPISCGPLAGYQYVRSGGGVTFNLVRDGCFVCAEPEDVVVCDRAAAFDWETFRFVNLGDGAQQFAQRVLTLRGDGQPVCLHFGCGLRRISGFLNIDKYSQPDVGGDTATDYYLFDFAEQAWPIADACVDYIFSEDFIEHIPQKNQILFLAEAFRVLKPGGCNRVSTPDLVASMQGHSDFDRGFAGVYADEFDKWGHVALFTQSSIREIALMIGYRRVFLTARDAGTSAHAVEDHRPGADRDELTGNIFADLIK
jgi:SAM-dependent methyltransferase